MAQITARPDIDLHLCFEVDESEARALDALAGYGDDAFIEVFYERLGKVYMGPHEAGLRKFLVSIRGLVSGPLAQLDDARKTFNLPYQARKQKIHGEQT